ncbi:MAG: hypothetical protein JST54_17360 [Deltaproteobacteria bacterium]|nr:hypothetical protein [Deltaproteobacteria bacterium]
MKRRSRWPILVVVALLLGAAAWLMGRGDPPEHTAAVEKLKFPERLRPAEYQRLQKRQTLRPEVAEAIAKANQRPPPKARDPLLAALPSPGPGRTAVVFEANALRNSPVGELLLDCMRARSPSDDPFAYFKSSTGIDPLKDIDRVAMLDTGVVASGNFQNANWKEVFKGSTPPVSYGQHAMIFTPAARSPDAPPANKRAPQAAAVWNNELIISSNSLADLRATIDKLEGRADPGPSILSDDESYGEVYGVLAPQDLADMLGSSQKELADKVLEAAQQVKLHVDAQNDVAMVADFTGPDGDKITDLGKTLGGVLSLGRLKAQSDGDQDMADLLDLARVVPEDGHFRAKLALPMDFLQQKLAWCRDHTDGGASEKPAPATAPAPAPAPAAPAPTADPNANGSTGT